MKWSWYVVMVLIWVIALVLGFANSWWYVLLTLITVNLVEYLFVGYWFGSRAKKNFWLNLGMCVIFGFVWWIPLRNKKEADSITPSEEYSDSEKPPQ